MQLSARSNERQEKLVGVKYGCLMALIPDPLASQIKEWTRKNVIPLHLSGKGLETEIHLTLKYGFIDDIKDRIEDAVSMFQPFTIKLHTLSLFKGNDDGDVLKLDVSGPILFDINRYVSRIFPCEDKYPVYKPHLTLAYLDPNFSSSYTVSKPPFLNTKVLISKLQYSSPDRSTRINIDLANNQKALSWLSSGSGADLVKPAKFPRTLIVPKSPFHKKSLEWDVKAGFTGQKTDKIGRKICYREGKRVSCNQQSSRATKQSTKAPASTPQRRAPVRRTAERLTPETARDKIREMISKNKVEKQDAISLAEFLNGLTVVQLNTLRRDLGISAKGKKAELTRQIAENVLTKAREELERQQQEQQQAEEQKPEKEETAEFIPDKEEDVAEFIPDETPTEEKPVETPKEEERQKPAEQPRSLAEEKPVLPQNLHFMASSSGYKSIIGRVSDELLAAAANAIDNSRVTVAVTDDDDDHIGQKVVKVNSVNYDQGYNKAVRSERTFYRNDQGDLVVHNNLFMNDGDKGKGKGTEIFTNQVKALREMGVVEIKTFAAKGTKSKFNGYYTWPRLGYDAELEPGMYSDLPRSLKNHMGDKRNLLKLFEVPEGREWWKRHGEGMDMTFDLREGSASMRALESYLEERKREGR